MIDRRRFLRAAGLGVAAVPLSKLLAACGDGVSPTTVGAASVPTTGLAATTAAAATVPTSPATTEGPPTTQAIAAAVAGALCRDAWGAKPSGPGLVPHTIERLTVHHTAAALTDNGQAPARLRGHQAYHQSLGWPDLAYHVAVDANGNIYAARSTDAKGDTATDYDPAGHFLVVAEGDFNAQPIPDAQLEGVATVLAWAAAEFSAEPSTIRGHRDWASTSCPGEAFYPLIADGTLERMVDDRLAAGGVDLRVVCDETALAAVEAIEAGREPPALATQAKFFLRDSNSAGTADHIIEFGDGDWIPIAGRFGE